MKSRRTASLRRKAWSSRNRASSGDFGRPLEWPFAVISSLLTVLVGVIAFHNSFPAPAMLRAKGFFPVSMS